MIEILGAGDRLHILNRSTAATASASWSQRIVGEMLEWAADAIGASLSDSHRRRWSRHSTFPLFCKDWREQECLPGFG